MHCVYDFICISYIYIHICEVGDSCRSPVITFSFAGSVSITSHTRLFHGKCRWFHIWKWLANPHLRTQYRRWYSTRYVKYKQYIDNCWTSFWSPLESR